MNVSGLKIRRSGLALAIVFTLGIVASPAMFARAQDALPDADVSSNGVDSDAVSPDKLPLPINVQGTWSGTISDDDMGAGTLTISITQTNRKLSGGWSATFSSTSFLGEFNGRATAKMVRLHLSHAQFEKKTCELNFKSTVANGTEISGSYKWAYCGGQFKHDKGGTIDIFPVPPV